MVYLTMWQEGHRPLIKQLTHKEANRICFSHNQSRDRVEPMTRLTYGYPR
jgi:hypothetical protein